VRRGEAMETFEWAEQEDEESGYVSGPLMTIGEAARYLGVSRKTVYALLESGRLTALKGKKSVKLVSRESLDDFRSGGELT
jgi:excisionase family DNA binding protein